MTQEIKDDESREQVILVIPTEKWKADDLVPRLNSSGYDAVAVTTLEEILALAGLVPADVEVADLEQFDEWIVAIEHIMHSSTHDEKARHKSRQRLLGYIALSLASIAKTHARAMPPVV